MNLRVLEFGKFLCDRKLQHKRCEKPANFLHLLFTNTRVKVTRWGGEGEGEWRGSGGGVEGEWRGRGSGRAEREQHDSAIYKWSRTQELLSIFFGCGGGGRFCNYELHQFFFSAITFPFLLLLWLDERKNNIFFFKAKKKKNLLLPSQKCSSSSS